MKIFSSLFLTVGFLAFMMALSSLTALAAGKDVDDALTSGVSNQQTGASAAATFHAELKAGFHFNEQAPNLLSVDGEKVKPQSIEKRSVVFAFPHQDYQSARAMLYICDDKLTFCEPKGIEIKSAGGPVAKSEKSAPSAELPNSPAAKPLQKTAVIVNAHGFIADNLPAACEQARTAKKLVLVDVAARWCPGCIRLETEVFDTAEFKKAARGFVKVRLDYDRFENGSVKGKFGIQGIPSLIVMTPDQAEIARVVDYQPTKTLTAFLHESEKHPQPFSELKLKADGGNAEASRMLGLRLYAASRFSESLAYLAKAVPPAIELADARVQAAKAEAIADPAKNAAFLETTRAAIATEPRSSRSLMWRAALIERLDPKSVERKKIADEGTALADQLLKSKPADLKKAMIGDAVGEFTGLEKLYLASERADLIEAAGLGEEANLAAMKVVAEVGREMKIPLTNPGPALRYLIFLIAAHEYPEAEKQAHALLQRDPKNPEYQRRLLRVLNEEKKFTEAVTLGKETLPKSFGKNEVWVAQQLAKAYKGAGEKAQAHQLAAAYLKRADINWDAMKSEQKDLTEVLHATQ